MEVHAVKDRSDKHRLGAQRRIIERELPLRIGLGIGDRLHPALQLNQDYFDRGGGLAGCCVRDFAL